MALSRAEQIQALYQAALERPVSERAAFLAAQSASDPELRRSVEQMLSRRDATDLGANLRDDADTAAELPIGAQVAHYRIESVLGRGGMGIVYRATDTKLNRSVAIKFLSVGAADVQTRERFRQEARTASGLNHPHIVTVHDVGEHSGREYIVSELVDGGTLGDWAMRPRTWRQCVELLTGVADAIAAAHAAGVLHRDIKPGNILIGANGYAKLADFGLAKLVDRGPNTSGARAAPKTGVGVVIGTVAYMSPEQASGQPLDARSDVFSFGAVLHELLAGQRPFEGATDLEVLKSIVHANPAALPSTVPDALRTIVDKALEKDPAERYQHMQDLVVDLRRVARKASSASQPTFSAELPKARRRYAWLLGGAGVAVVLAALAVPAALYFLSTPPSVPEMRFEISVPDYVGNLAISPKGDRIAYVASVGGRRQIWIRPFDTTEARPLTGTDGATGLFWSPDGQRLGYFADGKLKRIDANGGPSQTLAESVLLTAPGAWNRDGTILYSLPVAGSGGFAQIASISQSGGASTPVTRIDTATTERLQVLPRFLEDGDRFLYLSVSEGSSGLAVKIASLSGAMAKTLVSVSVASRGPQNGGPYAYGSGHLLYRLDNGIAAQALDARAQALSGRVAPVAANARDFSVSDNGILVYTTQAAESRDASNERRFTWFDRDGKVVGRVDAAPGAINATLSPDQRRVAFNTAVQDPNPDVWVVDLERGAATRRTFDPNGASSPIWSPDGSRLLFNSRRGLSGPATANQLFMRASNGSGSDEPLYSGEPGEFLVPSDWSADGNHILFERMRIETMTERADIWVLPTTGERTPFRLFESDSINEAAKLSPDGRWVVYCTNQSGVRQIVVRPFPDASGGLWQVSTSGGMEPHWRADGKELFYLGLDGALMAVDVESGEAFEFGAPHALFQTGIAVPAIPLEYFFDVAADGQRFLVNTNAPAERAGEEQAQPTRISVVVNWTSSLPH
jgi:serine/threonine protein kinase/Tol biopolymer transport system component